jgi:hypothetical protein
MVAEVRVQEGVGRRFQVRQRLSRQAHVTEIDERAEVGPTYVAPHLLRRHQVIDQEPDIGLRLAGWIHRAGRRTRAPPVGRLPPCARRPLCQRKHSRRRHSTSTAGRPRQRSIDALEQVGQSSSRSERRSGCCGARAGCSCAPCGPAAQGPDAPANGRRASDAPARHGTPREGRPAEAHSRGAFQRLKDCSLRGHVSRPGGHPQLHPNLGLAVASRRRQARSSQ